MKTEEQVLHDENNCLLALMSSLLECTPQQFSILYLPTLEKIRAVCEPLCIKHQLSYAECLNDELKFSYRVLRFKQGVVLGGLDGIEAMVMEAPGWNYGLFLSACLVSVSQFLIQESILAANKSWKSFVPDHYQCWFKENVKLIKHVQDIFKYFPDYLQAQHLWSNPLIALVQKADKSQLSIQLKATTTRMDIAADLTQQVFEKEIKENIIEVTSLAESRQPLMDFMIWLSRHAKLDIDVFVVEEGLLVTHEILENFLKNIAVDQKENFLMMINSFLQKNDAASVLLEALTFTYRPNNSLETDSYEGVVILRDYLSAYWLEQKTNQTLVTGI